MSQKTLNLCLERYNFVKFGETTKSSHTVLCINNAYSVNSDKYRLTPTAIASKHGDGYGFTLNYDFDRPLFTIVQKSYTLDGTSGSIVFEGIDPISKGGSKYLRKVTVSPVKLSDGSYLLEVTNDEYLRIGTTGAALGDEDLESLNEKIVATGGIEKSVETVGGKQVLKLDASGSTGAKEIVYFEVDPSDPPSGIHTAIGEALSNNKLPAIRSDGKLYLYTSTSTDHYKFVGVFSTSDVGYETFMVWNDDTVDTGKLESSLGYTTLPAEGTEEHPAWAKVCELDLENLSGYTSYGLALLFTSDHINQTDEPSESGIFIFDVGSNQYSNSNSRNASWIAYTEGAPYQKILGVKIICKYGIPSNPAYAPYPFYKAEVWVEYYGGSNIMVNALQNMQYNSFYPASQGVYKFPENHIATTQSTEPSYSDTEEYTYRYHFYPAESPSVAYTYSQSLTSDQKAQGRDNIGAASASDVTALQSQVSSLSDVSAYTVKGEATVAQLNAGPSGIQAGWAYQLTDSGTLTEGTLAVVAGDTVAWDGTKWFPLVKSDYYATKTYAQNVAASIAPPFDPTRDSEHAYPAGYSVTYTNGKTYVFTAPHYGPWTGTDVTVIDLSAAIRWQFVTNGEYLLCCVDKDNAFVFGVRKDGSFAWQKGIPVHVRTFVESNVKGLKDYTDSSLQTLNDAIVTGLSGKVDKVTGKSLVDENFASQLSVTSNGEYLYCIVDSQNRFVAGVRKDGSFAWQKGIPSHVKVYVESVVNNLSVSVDSKLSGKVDKVTGKSLVETVHADSLGNLANNEFLYAVIDSGGHVLVALRTDGSVNFFGNVHFAGDMKLGDDAMESLFKRMNSARFVGDYTERKEAKIAEPYFATVNILGVVVLPGSKGNEIKAWMEFFDGNGNYFKKRIIMDGQGNSTLEYPKHNIAIDICNDEWEGDDTFKVAFGSWPAQDSFHIKAFWVDPFSGAIATGLYDYLDKIWMDRGFENDAPWKKALVRQSMHGYEMKAVKDYNLRIDTGGRNHPQAFPCALYVNGKFHGVYAFSEKKSRDVYHEKKDDKNNIHLDGEMGRFWLGEIDWTTFEVRVPKSLICMDGSKYNGDAPLELIDTTSPNYNSSNSKHVMSKNVKERVINASLIMTTLDAIVTEHGADSEEFKTAFAQYFDLDNLIDYVIFTETILDTDSGVNNVQWVTYDGVKWWACPYDLDRCLGNWYGYFNRTRPGHFAMSSATPFKYIGSCPTFLAALEARYAELRDKGIVSVDSIFEVVHKWVQRCGYDMIKADWDRWPNKPCNMDTVVNSDYWEMVLEDGKPVSGTYNYNANTAYAVGDEAFYGRRWASGGSELNDCVKFKCIAPSTGNAPCLNVYSRDSEWRIYEFLKWWIPEMDSRYNYTPNN